MIAVDKDHDEERLYAIDLTYHHSIHDLHVRMLDIPVRINEWDTSVRMTGLLLRRMDVEIA
jgi:hypothetical protein